MLKEEGDFTLKKQVDSVSASGQSEHQHSGVSQYHTPLVWPTVFPVELPPEILRMNLIMKKHQKTQTEEHFRNIRAVL